MSIYIDRSTMEADWRCGQERYWLTEYRSPGRESDTVGGCVPKVEVWDLAFGSAFADGVAALGACIADDSSKLDPEEIIGVVAAPMYAMWGRPSGNLLSGMLYGALFQVFPRLLVDYDITQIEKECFYHYQGGKLVFMSRPDLVLRRTMDNTVWVPDWKTTKWKDIKWLLDWNFAAQLHIQCAAVQQSCSEYNVQGSLILGAYKGYVDEYRGNVRVSPFTVAYRRNILNTTQWSAKYAAGYERVPVDEYPGGIKAWVERINAEWPTALAEQFPISQPIMYRDDFVQMVCEERLWRENAIAAWRDHKESTPMASMFEHRTANCKRCNYQQACWSPTVGRDPCANGLYVPRMPNHTREKMIYITEHPAPPSRLA